MKLYEITSDIFLYLVTFRRRVRKGLPVTESEVRSQLEALFIKAQGRAEADPLLDPMWQKAHYALAVLADEIALDAQWDGQGEWSAQLLEQRFFQTSIGGVRFFELVEEIREGEPELAEIYYLCLALGFCGKYAAGSQELDSYRRKLMRMLPDRIPPDEKRITPQAYHVVEGEAKGSPMVNLVRIAIACGVFVLAYVIISQVVFHMSVDSIHQIATEIAK